MAKASTSSGTQSSKPVEAAPARLLAAVKEGTAENPSPRALSPHMLRLFDYAHYAAQLGEALPPQDLAAHYKVSGAEARLSPHPDFNCDDYVEFNPDVPHDPLRAFEHYAAHGRSERRYASRSRLTRDAALVQRSELFDQEFYLSNYDPDLSKLGSAINHYLIAGWKALKRPNAKFDHVFYQQYFSDARQSGQPPFVHYLTEWKQGRVRYLNAKEADPDLAALDKSGLYDADFYTRKHGKLIPEGCEPRLHFLTDGQVRQLDCSPAFSVRDYVRKYPDLRTLERPVMHFILFGRNEKRSAVASRNPAVEQGRMLPDSGKPALLLVLHEASRTGAPILGYNLLRFLSRQFNVVTWLMKPGVLEQDIAKFSVAVVKAPAVHAELAEMAEEIIRRYGIDVAILNSAACNPMSDVIYELKVPIVSLVHEFKDYVLPRGAASKLAMFSDTVICPSDLILNSIAEECRDYAGWMPRHLASRHQGHCQLPQFAKSEHGGKARELPLKIRAALARKAGRPVILGAGWVHMRKGVELFIQAAQIYRETVDKDVLFVWVGGGYNPTGELNYSVWLQSQINIAGLEDTVIFAEEARTLQPFYDAAHGFFLSSRLDPFPNVAIDSAMAGLPVAVFDQATGFADVIRQAPDLGRIIPFLDLNAAVKILDGMVTERRADAGQKERIAKQAREIFDFAGYAEFVAEKCHGAIWNFGRTQAAAADLIEAGDFDERFFRSGLVNGYLNQLHETPAELLYLDLARKGFHPAKPRPGLNGAVGDESAGSPVVPAKIPAYSHPVHHLQFPVVQEASGSEINLRIAAHIHAFETKGIMEIVSRLADGPMAIDLFITSDEHSKLDEMQDGLIGIDNAVTWIRTPNRGRDIGPFLCGLPDEFWGHDVVGHFHVKASSHLDRQMTEQWKTFVYEHLIDGPDVLRQIFWRFESDPKLGLLFAEDPCQIGWTKNAKIAAELALRLGLEGPLPPAPEFPIGNMFWARSGALEPLRRLKLDWDDLPDEPVPSDGTLLHALERLTPAICGKAGYRWATVHRPDTQRFAKRRS